MKWIAEVGHVLTKDLRYSRWSIFALLAALALAASGYVTRHAFGPFDSANTETLGMSDLVVEYLPLIILLLGVMALAMVVQSDRPLQSDSFWTTRPLSPTAVFVAKLLVAIVAIIIPSLVAASVSLAVLHTPRAAALGILAHAALVQLALLMAVIVVAALTSDMKAFIATSVALLAGIVIGLGIVALVLPVDFTTPPAVSFIAPAVAIVVLAYLYRGQVSGAKQWLAGGAIAILLVIGTAAAPAFRDEQVPMLPAGPRLSATFGWPWGTSIPIPFSIQVQDASPARFAFGRDLTVITGRKGARRLTPVNDTLMAGPQFPDLGRSIRWLTPALSNPPLGQLARTRSDIEAVLRDATSAEVSGTVTMLRPLVLANLPLRQGAFVERDGRFVSIYGLSHDSSAVAVYVHTVNPPLAGRHAPQFAVVNYARGEALLLDEHRSGASGTGWLVLPWISVESTFDRFETNDRTTVPRDSAWYAGASLAVVEWIPVGQYHASATMPMTTPRAPRASRP